MSRTASFIMFFAAISLLVIAHLTSAAMEEEGVNEARALLGTEWWVEDIDHKGVVDRVHTTISFPETGRVAGDGGCNRYMGSVEIVGDTIRFGRLAGTMMMCPQAVMNQEQHFHQTMDRVSHWKVDDKTGLLHLMAPDGTTVIRAWEVTEDNPSREL